MQKRTAIIHDWLTGMRGGERCLETFLKIYSEADVYTLIHIKGSVSDLIESRVKGTSFLNKLPGIHKYYRYCLPMFPLAVADLSKKLVEYDHVICLSHAAVKNIKVPANAKHTVYCFTPMRYIWDKADEYFGAFTKILQPLLALLRRWDKNIVNPQTKFIAISNFVAARIRKYYKVRATVIYPPVNTDWITPRNEDEPGEAFLLAGALVPYKNPEMAVKVFKKLRLPLWIVGSGPLEEKIKLLITGCENIKFLGRVDDTELAKRYKNCRALIFPGIEDFGMMPVECLAAGRPVIAYDRGGLREIIEDGVNGLLFGSGRGDDIEEALEVVMNKFLQFEECFTVKNCVERAAVFSEVRFSDAIVQY